MKNERKRVIFYLRPDLHTSDKYVYGLLEQSTNHSQVTKQAMYAGFALGLIDKKLPNVLASILSDDIDAETLKTILLSLLNASKNETDQPLVNEETMQLNHEKQQSPRVENQKQQYNESMVIAANKLLKQ